MEGQHLPAFGIANGEVVLPEVEEPVRVRTYLENRARELVNARTDIVEDRGRLAFLFLNNNLHVVHHLHPGVAWYDLPRRYANCAHFLRLNDDFAFTSYVEVFRRHFW